MIASMIARGMADTIAIPNIVALSTELLAAMPAIRKNATSIP